MDVPFLDLRAQHRTIKDEILGMWSDILDSAYFVGGEHVEGLETEFAEAVGTKHAVAVNSGTDALRFVFLALGLEQGDEVVTVPNTFIATTESISQAGGTPVFVDVSPDTCNIDVSRIESAITSRTKGIVPVHLYGQCADMDPLLEIAERHGLWVVEDACQAHLAEYKGRKAGTMGAAAAFSFYPGKNMGACGEGGAITTDDAALAGKVRMLRDHGQAEKYHHDVEGYNGRLDAVQAAALRVKLRHLPEWNEARRAHAERYRELLTGAGGVELPSEPDWSLPVYHLFVVQVPQRERVIEALKQSGVATGLHYPLPLHLQNAYSHLGLGPGSFPVTETCAERILSLPMFPELTDEQIAYVCDCLREAVA